MGSVETWQARGDGTQAGGTRGCPGRKTFERQAPRTGIGNDMQCVLCGCGRGCVCCCGLLALIGRGCVCGCGGGCVCCVAWCCVRDVVDLVCLGRVVGVIGVWCWLRALYCVVLCGGGRGCVDLDFAFVLDFAVVLVEVVVALCWWWLCAWVVVRLEVVCATCAGGVCAGGGCAGGGCG